MRKEEFYTIDDFMREYEKDPQSYMFNQLIDDITFNVSRNEFAKMVEKEPGEYEGTPPHFGALIAGVVGYFCEFYHMKEPHWIYRKKYFLPKPWFVSDDKKIRRILFETSPMEFKRRNIFIADNTFTRM